MPSLNSTVKAARITNEEDEVLEEYLEKTGQTFTGFTKKNIERLSNGFETADLPMNVVEDIGIMVMLSGGEMDTFLRDLDDKMNDGRIELEDGLISGYRG